MTWLFLDTQPAIEFFTPGMDRAGLTAPIQLPRMASVGRIVRAAVPGGRSELGNFEVQLANGDGALSRRFSFPCVYAMAQLKGIVRGQVVVLAEGRVRSIEIGASVRLQVGA